MPKYGTVYQELLQTLTLTPNPNPNLKPFLISKIDYNAFVIWISP